MGDRRSEIGGQSLARALRVAATWPAERSRALVAALLPIQCGARVPRRKALAAQHYGRRAGVIADLQEAIGRQLGYALSETLRNLEEVGGQKSEVREEIRAAEGRLGVAADVVFDKGRFSKGLLGTIRTEAATVLQRAGEEVFEELAGMGYEGLDPFSMPDPAARAYLDSRENLLTDIPDDIHRQIEETIQGAMDKGKSLAEMARDIRTKFEEMENGRAETIASTETAAAYSTARQQGFVLAGVKYKTWLTSHLPTVRDTHRDAEDDARNARVPVEEAFYVGAVRLLAPGIPFSPADNDPGEIINCHCVALALEGDA